MTIKVISATSGVLESQTLANRAPHISELLIDIRRVDSKCHSTFSEQSSCSANRIRLGTHIKHSENDSLLAHIRGEARGEELLEPDTSAHYRLQLMLLSDSGTTDVACCQRVSVFVHARFVARAVCHQSRLRIMSTMSGTLGEPSAPEDPSNMIK